MPLIKSASKAAFKTNVSEMIRAGHPRAQSLAAAYSTARKAGAKFASGGDVNWAGKQFAHNLMREGLISSPFKTPGRADKIPLKVLSGSSVVPADVVSGLGQGNSQAGAKILSKMLSTGPYGVPKPKGGSQMRFPRAPRVSMRADGGDVEAPENFTDILASDGEWIVHRDMVKAVGGGDLDLGHKIMNSFYEQVRKQNINDLKKMKGPHK